MCFSNFFDDEYIPFGDMFKENLKMINNFIQNMNEEIDETKGEVKKTSYANGVLTSDFYKDGEHLSHEVKKLKDGKWVPVEGYSRAKCCDKPKIKAIQEDVEKTGGINYEEEIKSRDNVIDRLNESNRYMAKENAKLKEDLRMYGKEMERINKLMESMVKCISEYKENK